MNDSSIYPLDSKHEKNYITNKSFDNQTIINETITNVIPAHKTKENDLYGRYLKWYLKFSFLGQLKDRPMAKRILVMHQKGTFVTINKQILQNVIVKLLIYF